MRLSFLLILLTGITLVSCLDENRALKQMEISLKEFAWSAKNVELGEASLTQPPFTWRLVLKLDSQICLLYRTPLGDDLGVLRLVKSSQLPCTSEAFDEPLIHELLQVKDLSLRPLPKRESFLEQEKEVLVQGAWMDQGFEWKLKYPYAALAKPAKKPEKLMSSASYQDNVLQLFHETQNTLGTWDQRYSDGDFSFCHRVNQDCEDVQEYQCDRCRFGWVEVVDHFCPQGGSKICGRNRCGERGEPACPRGRSFLEENVDGPCFTDSTAGFCGPGLSTSCDENGVLICI